MNRPQNIKNRMNVGAICTYVVRTMAAARNQLVGELTNNSKNHLDGYFFLLLLNTFAIKSVLHGVDGGRTDRRILFRRRVVRFINFAIGYSTAFCVYHTVYLPRPLNFQIKFQFCITSSLAHNATDAIVCDCSGQTALVELSVAQRKPAAVEIESIRFNG